MGKNYFSPVGTGSHSARVGLHACVQDTRVVSVSSDPSSVFVSVVASITLGKKTKGGISPVSSGRTRSKDVVVVVVVSVVLVFVSVETKVKVSFTVSVTVVSSVTFFVTVIVRGEGVGAEGMQNVKHVS